MNWIPGDIPEEGFFDEKAGLPPLPKKPEDEGGGGGTGRGG